MNHPPSYQHLHLQQSHHFLHHHHHHLHHLQCLFLTERNKSLTKTKTKTDDGNEIETIETEIKIDQYQKMPRILQNRVKTYDLPVGSRFHVILVRSYHDFACFSILLSIWIE